MYLSSFHLKSLLQQMQKCKTQNDVDLPAMLKFNIVLQFQFLLFSSTQQVVKPSLKKLFELTNTDPHRKWEV
jgi:hypothetical protein